MSLLTIAGRSAASQPATSAGVAASYRMSVPSARALKMAWPSGENWHLAIFGVLKVSRSRPVAASHSLAVPSNSERIRRPSGENATNLAVAVFRVKAPLVSRDSLLCVGCTLITASGWLTVTSQFPSGENADEVTPEILVSPMTDSSRAVAVFQRVQSGLYLEPVRSQRPSAEKASGLWKN